jgi:uncharacterized membrane protein
MTKKKEVFILLLCIVLGFALRFYHYDKKSLWVDEIYTFNDSRDDFGKQLEFYKENPSFLHPPLFFILTHQFYPFNKPEKDLRVLPLIFGMLSIPLIYVVSNLFSPSIALPCTLSLTFMTYHISLSQDGRSYSLLMFLGMASLFFFIKYLKTLKKIYLLPVGVLYAILFHTSYSSIPFILFSQVLWFYRPDPEGEKPNLSSFFFLSGLTLLLCLPWILFVTLHYGGEPWMDPLHKESPGSLTRIVYGLFNDWVPQFPLMIVSAILVLLFPFFSKPKKKALVLLGTFVLPIGGLYLFCRVSNITHFVTSRYFINFLPLFFITIYLSLNALEDKFERLKRFIRFVPFFLILFIASNLVILPLYYQSEKEDYRGLVTYLKGQLREGDRIFVTSNRHLLGILHYFGVYPEGRHYLFPFRRYADGGIEFNVPFIYKDKTFIIDHSKTCCSQYVFDKNRLWIVAGRDSFKEFSKYPLFVLKGYFDGSFLNLTKFPEDASMYLLLLDPKSTGENGIKIPVE